MLVDSRQPVLGIHGQRKQTVPELPSQKEKRIQGLGIVDQQMPWQ